MGWFSPRDRVPVRVVVLVEPDAVDPDRAVADLDVLTADGDDALDEGRLVALALGVEDDDVAPRVVVEARRELVDEQVLLGLEGVEHGLLLDAEGLDDERRDDEVEDDRETDRGDDLDDGIEGP